MDGMVLSWVCPLVCVRARACVCVCARVGGGCVGVGEGGWVGGRQWYAQLSCPLGRLRVNGLGLTRDILVCCLGTSW